MMTRRHLVTGARMGDAATEIRVCVGKREALDDLEGIYVGADTRAAGILRQESLRTVDERARTAAGKVRHIS